MNLTLSSMFILLVFSFTALSQQAGDNVERLKKINSDVSVKYHLGDYDDAFKDARLALDLSTVLYGAEHAMTATAHSNIGTILQAKKKYRESAESFKRALEIYLKDPAKNGQSITSTLNVLGVILTLDKKREEAEPLFLKAVDTAETTFGKESRQVLVSLKSLTDFYIYTKQHDKAEDIFVRRYIVERSLIERKEADFSQEASDERFCYMSQNFRDDELRERHKRFDEKFKAERIARFGEDSTSAQQGVKNAGVINGGIINGKARSLPKPPYPDAAKPGRLGGTVSVRVLIAEDGKVLSAKAFCGNPVFYAVTEQAARLAEFSPTTLGGKPVKVSGNITYNFVP